MDHDALYILEPLHAISHIGPVNWWPQTAIVDIVWRVLANASLSKCTYRVYFRSQAGPSTQVGEAHIPDGNAPIDIPIASTVELKF